MLLRFGVENHGSILSYQELQLTASSLKDNENCLVEIGANATDDRRSLKVLPVAGIYGANAAGKSTLLRAIEFFVNGIARSHSRIAGRKGTPYYPYQLDTESKSKPSRYDADIVLDNHRYHYGYVLDGNFILQEWLYSFDLTASRQVRSVLFSRETSPSGEVEIAPGKSLKGENKQISKLVRPNSLFLSVAAQNSHPQLSPIFDYFEKVVQRLDAGMSEWALAEQLTGYFSANPQRMEAAIEFLKAADIGITGMDFAKVPMDDTEKGLVKDVERMVREHAKRAKPLEGEIVEDVDFQLPVDKPLVKIMHKGQGGSAYSISLKWESTGTQALLQLLGPVLVKLNEGGMVIIDELNTALHPLVSRELIKLFQSPTTNPGHAQLIFTTHDTNLLTGSLLRRDQVWFTEKDSCGSTHVYSLSDIKVRSTDNVERGYLMGRFGAIPFMGCGLDEFAQMIEKNSGQKG